MKEKLTGGYSDLYIKDNFTYREHVKFKYVVEFKHIKAKAFLGDINTLSYVEFKELNKELIDKKQKEAEDQLENYIKDYNLINDSDRILKKFTVVTLGRKYVIYKFI